MLRASSEFKTEKPSKYLMQLCKHFARKVDVTFNELEGNVNFPGGAVVMKSLDEALLFEIEADDEHKLSQCKSVVESHIVKFAFREKLSGLDWQNLDETPQD